MANINGIREYATAEEAIVDWNNSDPSSGGYVKNRPCHIEKDVEVLPLTQVSREKITDMMPLPPYGFEVGKTYKVTYDGTEYNCEYKYNGTFYLGNYKFYDSSSLEDTGEPFCYFWYRYYGYPELWITTNSSGDHTIKIDGILEEVSINTDNNNSCYLTPILEENTNYMITWNGIQYNLTCTKEENYYYLGNKSLNISSDENTVDSGEDFLFYKYENGPLAVCVREEGEYTYSIDGLLPEQTIIANGYGYVTLDSVIEMVEGESYKIIFDNTEYICVAKYYSSNSVYLGNYSNCTEDYYDNSNEPFCITNTSWGEVVTNVNIPVGDHTIHIAKDVYHILDDRFLPPLVGRYSTGEFAETFNNIFENIASGKYSHAEGNITLASGFASHAEGQNTTASSYQSHAEGSNTTASRNVRNVNNNGTLNNNNANNNYALRP